MFIGVKVDESAKLKHQLTATQSMPEALCNLDLNVSIHRFVKNLIII